LLPINIHCYCLLFKSLKVNFDTFKLHKEHIRSFDRLMLFDRLVGHKPFRILTKYIHIYIYNSYKEILSHQRRDKSGKSKKIYNDKYGR